MKKRVKDTLSAILFIIFALTIFGVLIYVIVYDNITDEKYGEKRYEFVITDMYEDLGSKWHLVGGRATEQKYHILYKYRLTNQPDCNENLVWYSSETTVRSSTYRNLHIGQTLYGNSMIFPHQTLN